MKIGSRLILAEDKLRQSFQRITLKTILPSGEAKTNAILSPLLGQHQINIMSFCNEFNLKSNLLFEKGVELPVFINLKKDKTYNLTIRFPLFSFFMRNVIKNKNQITISNLFDIILIFCYFLKQKQETVSLLIFGYLSSYSKNEKIKIKFN